MNIEWKPTKLVDVTFGSIVYIKNEDEPYNILENIYMVLDESVILNKEDIDPSVVYIADLEDGTIYLADSDVECMIVEGASIQLPQHIKNQSNNINNTEVTKPTRSKHGQKVN